jgi:RNA polymerase sigma-70 factor, ECF subfamily
MGDLEAIKAVLGGDVDAFAEVVKRHHRALYYFVIGKIADDCEAEDVVQKTFVTAYRKLSTFDQTQPLYNWLRGIALGHCRNQWKTYERQARLRERLIDARRGELEFKRLEHAESAADDRSVLLQECMRMLSEHEQETLKLRFTQQLSLKQIGEIMQKNSEAVRFFLMRIRLRLRTCVRSKLAMQEDH